METRRTDFSVPVQAARRSSRGSRGAEHRAQIKEWQVPHGWMPFGTLARRGAGFEDRCLADRDYSDRLRGASVDSVRAILDYPRVEESDVAVLFAHGAGAPLDSDFMERTARALAREGYAVMRFSYIYAERAQREGRRFPPDRQPVLELAHRAALEALHAKLPGRRVVLAGKSMGGRISSHLAAAGVECAGLIYFGYPLHPQGEPAKLRSAHFPEISTPSLFLQGSRDGLCDVSLLRRELENYRAPHELVVIDEGDHSFDVLKRSGRSPQDVEEQVIRSTTNWLRKQL